MKRAALLLGVALLASSSVALAGTVTEETHQGRSVRVFAPSQPAPSPALVVMLHGCTQTPDDFADATQMEALAETDGFFVAFPEEPTSVGSEGCYEWFLAGNQQRGAGEPQSLADGTQEIVQARGVDPAKVYAAGLSAGGAMAVILGAAYPDRFAAIGVVAGVEYAAASSVQSGESVLENGGPDPNTQGDLARTAMGSAARLVPTLVIHGSSDGLVAPVNGDQVTAQWRRTNADFLGGDSAIAAPVEADGNAGYAFKTFVHREVAGGSVVVEQVVVEGLGHAWPGGKDGASFSDPKGPSATNLVWAFFSQGVAGVADATPPATPGAPSSSSSGANASSSGAPEGQPPAAPTTSHTSTGCTLTGPTRSNGPLPLALALAVAITLAARRRRSSLTADR